MTSQIVDRSTCFNSLIFLLKYLAFQQLSTCHQNMSELNKIFTTISALSWRFMGLINSGFRYQLTFTLCSFVQRKQIGLSNTAVTCVITHCNITRILKCCRTQNWRGEKRILPIECETSITVSKSELHKLPKFYVCKAHVLAQINTGSIDALMLPTAECCGWLWGPGAALGRGDPRYSYPSDLLASLNHVG